MPSSHAWPVQELATGGLDPVAVHDHSGVVQVCMNQGNGTFVDVTATLYVRALLAGPSGSYRPTNAVRDAVR